MGVRPQATLQEELEAHEGIERRADGEVDQEYQRCGLLGRVRRTTPLVYRQGAGRIGGFSMARRVRCNSISLISTAGAAVDTGT